MAGVVERGADGGDLAVHHPRRRHDVGAGVGLGHRGPGVEVDGGVVVDVAVGGRARRSGRGRCTRRGRGRPCSDDVVADLVPQVAQRDLHDAVGVPGPGALGVLVLRDAEQDDAGDAEVGQLGDLLAQRLAGVLHDAGQRRSAAARRCPRGRTAGRQVVDRQRVSATSRRRAGVRRSRRSRRWGKAMARQATGLTAQSERKRGRRGSRRPARSTTRSAAGKVKAAVMPPGTATTRRPAARAASTPLGRSSSTTQRPGLGAELAGTRRGRGRARGLVRSGPTRSRVTIAAK